MMLSTLPAQMMAAQVDQTTSDQMPDSNWTLATGGNVDMAFVTSEDGETEETLGTCV